jgi:hypothetical protein
VTRKDSRDELRDLLFEAARLDRASDVARARALAKALGATSAAPVESVEGRVVGDEPAERARVVQLGRRAARGVPIGLALVAAVIALIVLRREARSGLQLSPASERVSANASGNPREPAPSLSATAWPSPSDVAKTVPSVPSRAPRQNAGKERDAGARGRLAPPSLDDEVTTLENARAALASGDTKKALELLASYQNVLHGTRLTAEATLLKIEALANSGRKTEAAEMARRFIDANRGNPLVDRARRFAEAPPAPSHSEIPKPGDVP